MSAARLQAFDECAQGAQAERDTFGLKDVTYADKMTAKEIRGVREFLTQRLQVLHEDDVLVYTVLKQLSEVLCRVPRPSELGRLGKVMDGKPWQYCIARVQLVAAAAASGGDPMSFDPDATAPNSLARIVGNVQSKAPTLAQAQAQTQSQRQSKILRNAVQGVPAVWADDESQTASHTASRRSASKDASRRSSKDTASMAFTTFIGRLGQGFAQICEREDLLYMWLAPGATQNSRELRVYSRHCLDEATLGRIADDAEQAGLQLVGSWDAKMRDMSGTEWDSAAAPARKQGKGKYKGKGRQPGKGGRTGKGKGQDKKTPQRG